MELTCVECGFVGDHRTHFDIPKEPGKGLCKYRDSCVRRASLRKMAASPLPDVPKFTRDELHERDHDER
jgi:hypothetical protein